MKQLTERQKELLINFGNMLEELAEQCEHDENFHNIMIDNNDIIPMSLDELAYEWYAIARGDKRERIDGK